VTVSFKVTVNTNIGAVGITNKATVEDGNNKYTTNEVYNYIPHAPGGDQPQTPPQDPQNPVPGPNDNAPEASDGAPKTGDNANLPVWYAVLILSGLGILVTCIPTKKRRR